MANSLMKDKIGEQAAINLATVLSSIIDDFDRDAFIQEATTGLYDLELKDRVDHLIIVLTHYLPSDFALAAEALLGIDLAQAQFVKPEEWGDFTLWPLVDYAGRYGLQHPALALSVLKHLTKLFSAEFAIRPLLEHHFELSYDTLWAWTTDDNEHVRRLSSEGLRARLPWGKQLPVLQVNYDKIIHLIDRLKDDDSLYVRRSVANNLNDISKQQPDRIIALCQTWHQSPSKQRKWLVKHALRSLIKAGRPEVFPLLGYTQSLKIVVEDCSLSRSSVLVGESFDINMTVKSLGNGPQSMVIDYSLDAVKANGKRSTKVFKWKDVSLPAEGSAALTKKHQLKVIAARQYYPGQHCIHLVINGQKVGRPLTFELIT